MSKLNKINQANLTVGPTSMYDSSVAMKNALRKRMNFQGKRAQAYGVNAQNKQISGVNGDHSDHVFYMNLFPRMRLEHNTV
mgnify:CR=1 FL=1|tara:strand:+ start:439 stop:681 length:243 start_codon:yes stop_codon:yes gene_type:complete